MGTSTSLRHRLWCAGGSSCIRCQQGTRHQDSRGLSPEPTENGKHGVSIQHPTPLSTKTKDGCRHRHTASTEALRAQQEGKWRDPKGYEPKDVLVMDGSFKSSLPLLGLKHLQSKHQQSTQRSDLWKRTGKRIVAIKIRRSTGKRHTATQMENYWAKKQEKTSRCWRFVPLLCWQSRTAAVALKGGRQGGSLSMTDVSRA